MQALLLDMDGVVVTGEDFADCLKRDLGLTREDTKDFFTGVFRDCQMGKADLKKKIAPYLSTWGWKKSVDEFLEYWFTSHSRTDEQLLRYVQELRAKKTLCYLVGNQEKYRAEYLGEVVGLRKSFDGVFVSAEVGYLKEDQRFFEHVLRELRLPPAAVLHFDDSERCVASAQAAGIRAHLYTGYQDFVQETENFVS